MARYTGHGVCGGDGTLRPAHLAAGATEQSKYYLNALMLRALSAEGDGTTRPHAQYRRRDDSS